MSLAKIFIYRPHNQFTNQITLLCDGNDHCKYRINVAKPVCGNQMRPTTLMNVNNFLLARSILAAHNLFKEVVGKKSGFYVNEIFKSQ